MPGLNGYATRQMCLTLSAAFACAFRQPGSDSGESSSSKAR